MNNSKSKYVTVGLSYDFQFQPCITLGGNKTFPIVLSEFDWKELLQYQGLLANYFHSEESFPSEDFSSFTISFEKYNDNKFIKIKNRRGNYVCIGSESLTQLWSIVPLINFRFDSLKKLDFQKYFNTKLSATSFRNGDICQQILTAAVPTATNNDTENVNTIMELVYLHPTLPEFGFNCNLQYYTTY